MFWFFFFFKQKTAYEMVRSDWSSDVCSSDLRGLEARGHEVWVLAPRFPGAVDDPPRVLRYPSIPATTYTDFLLAIPLARRLAARVRDLDVDVFHAHHPFLLGPAAARLARRLGRP